MSQENIKPKEIVLSEALSWRDVPIPAWINAIWLYTFNNGANIFPVNEGAVFEGSTLPRAVEGVVVSPRVQNEAGQMVIKKSKSGIEEYGGGYYRYSKWRIARARKKMIEQRQN